MTMALKISSDVKRKLHEKHSVSVREVKECFANKRAGDLEDTRADHKTNPPTRWFIAETDRGRLMKIIYMLDGGNNIHIKSAYEPEAAALRIYNHFYPNDQ